MNTKTVKKEQYKLCPDCGNFISYKEQENYCYLCGAQMLSECPSCKEPIIYPTSQFCPVCGKYLLKLNMEK